MNERRALRVLMPAAGLVLSMIVYTAAQAACLGSTPTRMAANASLAEVQACVSAAASGDTITVPAGAYLWSTPLALPGDKDVTLIGATLITCTGTPGSAGYTCAPGATKTTLTCPAGCFVVDLGASHRISGFQLVNANGSELISSTGDQNASKHFRIDHNHLTTTVNAWSPIRFAGGGNGVHPQGIWDHNRIEGGIAIHTLGTNEMFADSCATCQHQLWAAQPMLGDSTQVVYVEANHFTVDAGDRMVNFADGNYGARGVHRFNTLSGPSVAGFEYHSVQGDNRAYQRWEAYYNAFVDTGATEDCFFGMAFIRGGTGVWFNNAMTGVVDGCQLSISLDNVRSARDVEVAGQCNGSSSWDQNTGGQQGWHCRDQIGVSHDNVQWNHSPPAPWNQNVKPAYFWGNTRSGSLLTTDVVPDLLNPVHIQANREFYDHSSATGSPQTVGVRSGPIASRPAGCTAGVAYWATDEGEWNNLRDGADGRLYKCTVTNTWALYYTPYPYPHPWTEEPGGPLSPPQNLRVLH